MMASSARVRTGQALPAVPARKAVRLWLWLPLTPLFWLLAPFALLLGPLFWVWLPRDRRPARPYAAIVAFGALLVSLSGTVIHVHAPAARVFIRIF